MNDDVSELKVIAVYNKNYKRVEGTWVSPTVGLAIRDNSEFLARVNKHFLDDLTLLEIGSFFGSRFVSLDVPLEHSWDEYKAPEKVLDNQVKTE